MLRLQSNFTLVLIMALMLPAPVLGGEWAGLSAKGPLAINIENAPTLFKQCSRPTPTPSSDIWIPSRLEIIEMEERLVKYFSSLDDQSTSDPRWSKSAYRGQHVGYGTGSDRFIYGAYVDERSANTQDKGEAILMCDGGPTAWGVLYNLRTGEISQLVTNGR